MKNEKFGFEKSCDYDTIIVKDCDFLNENTCFQKHHNLRGNHVVL